VDPSGIPDLDLWREAGGGERFELLQTTQAQQVQSRLLCRCTYAGRPFGDTSFVASFGERCVWRHSSRKLTLSGDYTHFLTTL
jgi:hypothetical protein